MTTPGDPQFLPSQVEDIIAERNAAWTEVLRLREALESISRTLPPDQDFYVLSREALLMFFGEMALPPWTDVDGTELGGAIDCALIASRITDWLKVNDLSDVYLGLDALAPSDAP